MKTNDFDSLLAAIVADDRAGVRKLLKADPGLATAGVAQPVLHRSQIFHWLYVNDTALHLAAAGHRVEIARILLAAKADPNAARNHRLGRPLHYAADAYLQNPRFDPKLQVKTIRCLLDAGADLHAVDKNGATALHRAVRTRCAEAVACLLDAGADPEALNHPGSTAFHLAVQNTGRGGSGDEIAHQAQRRIIELMLQRGVSPMLRTSRGRTVLESATSSWITELLTGGASQRKESK